MKKIENENKNKMKNENKNENIRNIRIYSYNSRGFDIIKQKICLDLMKVNDSMIPIICNQENFVLKGNSHIIRKALDDYHVYIKPATKNNFDGRPINGMFIGIRKDLRSKSKDISPSNDRIQAILLETGDSNLMIINVYFPPDPKTVCYNLDSELENVLVAVENLVASHQCRNVVMIGDMNTDYNRKNGRVNRFDAFLSNNSFESAWNKLDIDYTHEFEKEGITYTSTIDHVVWNAALSKKVLDAGVLHLVDNTSDHDPIYCDIQQTFKIDNVYLPVKRKPDTISTRVLEDEDWYNFEQDLDLRLKTLDIPDCIKCRNVHCKDIHHIHEVDVYAKNVLEEIDSAIKMVASTKRQNNYKAKIVPGWSEMVKPFCDEAKFWHAIWISAGRPLNTELHHIMKRTRNRYHYAIRKCKKASDNIKKDKLMKSCKTSGNDVFDEIRKLRHVTTEPPASIDGYNLPANRFAEVYGKLFNSTDDEEGTLKILYDIEGCINTDSLSDIDQVTTAVIEDVINEIKPNKNDPVFSFNSNCIKHAPTSLHLHLVNIIKCFLIHGHVSHILLVATIIPLIKDKLGDVESSENYRSIALSSVILKIIDWILMTLFGKKFGLDELQFSYQKNCSTTMCTWLVVESISHFTRNETDVYTCFMDMKKAFDMVKHSMLFQKLVDRNVPPIFLRLLLYMYMHQTAKVKWNGTLSDAFSILNGVKQGAVLSAILFCVYIDDLIKQLRRNRDGCWINNRYVGIIIYADDIVLLSPSLDGLQNMVDTCSKYANKFHLTFSTHEDPQKSKTKCMAFSRKTKTLRNIELNGKALPWVNKVKHLGSTITNNINCNMSQDLAEKRAAYIARNNELNQEFYYADPSIKIWLNNVYNSSFYGAPLWDLFDRDLEKLEKSWNTSQRIMLSLPRTTHRYFIEPLSETPHIIKSIKKRFLGFLTKIKKSKKEILRSVLRTIKNDCRSTTGRNLRKLKLEGNESNQHKIYDTPYVDIPKDDGWKIPMAREIMNIKSGKLKVEMMSRDEVDQIGEFVCSS